MTATFEIDEVINPESMGLQLKIVSLEPFKAVVVTNREPDTYVGNFFPVGRVLQFERANENSWTIANAARDMPWFILSARKRFEHYR